MTKPNFIVRWFYGRWIKILERANEDYNQLRKTRGLPPLDNIGRWVYEVDHPESVIRI